MWVCVLCDDMSLVCRLPWISFVCIPLSDKKILGVPFSTITSSVPYAVLLGCHLRHESFFIGLQITSHCLHLYAG